MQHNKIKFVRKPKTILQLILCFIYSKIYARWLYDDFFGNQKIVEKVLSWRTARVNSKRGSRQCITPCFLWFD